MTKNQPVVFKQGKIQLENYPHLNVMMDWETELMQRHAEIVCQRGGHILEIGFGMGISADFIQQQSIQSHTIVEVNPQILERAIEWSQDKPNVTIIEGDWFDVFKIHQKTYHGIWYDADCSHVSLFRKHVVDRFLNKNGIFTYFNPKGDDRYSYEDELCVDEITITCEIEPNAYHNDPVCKVPYFINK
jgi:type IV protein arginine methyltransferase